MTFDRWPNEDDMLAELYGGAWADFYVCQAGLEVVRAR
jgi:hypothetical protein